VVVFVELVGGGEDWVVVPVLLVAWLAVSEGVVLATDTVFVPPEPHPAIAAAAAAAARSIVVGRLSIVSPYSS